jgi:hypothetical protein
MKITLNELKKIIRKIIKEENDTFRPTYTDYLIIDKHDRAFVGVDHGITPILNPDEINTIKQIGDQYGYWYEGAGGDKEVVKPLFGNIEYRGSWDDKISSIESQSIYTYIYTLFANTEENNTLNKVNNSQGASVFDKILNSYKLWTHEKLKSKSKKEIRELLNQFIKELGVDYYQDSKEDATKYNVNNFILSVEEDMWDNWPDGENSAARLAFEANSERDQHLINTIKQGVFFIGKGHIVLLDKLLR